LLHHGDGHAIGVDGLDGLEEALRRLGRQPRRRLVEQQQRRIHHQRHGHGEDLALPARERARGVAALLAEGGEALEDRVDLPAGAGGIHVAADLEVLAHRHRGEDVLLLRHEGHAQRGDLPRRPALDRAIAQAHGAAVGRQDPRDHLEQRGLAGAVRADDAHDLAPLDGEAHALQHLVGGAVAGDDAFAREQRHAALARLGTLHVFACLAFGCGSPSIRRPI
jgi:hypothetical protein